MQAAELDKRFDYHRPTAEKAERHARVRAACKTLAEKCDEELEEGREKSTVMARLEEVMFWANASIARECPLELADQANG